MPLENLTYGRSWTIKDDFPTHQTSETAVRADLQYHPDAVADYINNKLLPTLRSPEGVAELGGTGEGNLNTRLNAMAARISTAEDAIKDVSLGDTPEAIRATVFSFDVTHWVEAGAIHQLWIAPAVHKRKNSNFGYTLKMNVEGIEQTGTWATAGTVLWYDQDTGSIVLNSPVAYKGSIVFFGV